MTFLSCYFLHHQAEMLQMANLAESRNYKKRWKSIKNGENLTKNWQSRHLILASNRLKIQHWFAGRNRVSWTSLGSSLLQMNICCWLLRSNESKRRSGSTLNKNKRVEIAESLSYNIDVIFNEICRFAVWNLLAVRMICFAAIWPVIVCAQAHHRSDTRWRRFIDFIE